MQQSEVVLLLIISCADVYDDEFEDVVIIDAVAGEIIDYTDSHTLRLDWSVLLQCVGLEIFSGGVDIRSLHRQEIGSKTRR